MNPIKIKENSLYGEIQNDTSNKSSSSIFQDKNSTFEFTLEKIQLKDLLFFFGYDESKLPDKYNIQIVQVKQKRKHHKKRINKKWLKKYGYIQKNKITKGWKLRCNTNGTTEFVNDNYEEVNI